MKLFKVFAAIVLIYFTLLGLAPISQAANIYQQNGLSISPLRNEISITPGFSYQGTLVLTDNSTQPMTVQLSAEKFSVINEQYDYSFTPSSDIAKWVTFDQNTVDLKPQESQYIIYSIGVPVTAEPGGRYISLFATTDIQTGGDSVKSEQRVGSLVYLTVAGNVTKIGRVVSLLLPLVDGGNSSWSIALQNSGTTHYRSEYSVELDYLTGGKATTVTTGSSLILPSTVRLITGSLPTPHFPGLYKAQFTIGLGDKPATKQTRYVLYIPPWFSLSLLTTVGLIVVTFAYIRSLRRSK